MRRLLRRPTGFRLAFFDGLMVSACLALPIVLVLGIASLPFAINPWDPVRDFAVIFVIAILVGGVCHTLPLVFQWISYRLQSKP